MHGSALSGFFPDARRPAVVALGSNLGDRAGTLEAALAELEARGNEIFARSSFCETKPVGYLDQPDFLNGVALVGVPAENAWTRLFTSCAVSAACVAGTVWLLGFSKHERDALRAIFKSRFKK